MFVPFKGEKPISRLMKKKECFGTTTANGWAERRGSSRKGTPNRTEGRNVGEETIPMALHATKEARRHPGGKKKTTRKRDRKMAGATGKKNRTRK